MIDPMKELAYIMATPGASAMPRADIDPLECPLWELDGRFLNPFAEVPEVQTFATMGERKALPLQGIITFSAKPKQGKSTATRALLLPILTGQVFDLLEPTESRPRLCIVFDTEMDTATLQERTKAMREALGADANRYQVVPLLETPKAQRIEVIEALTQQYNPDIVVIDQVAMLVDNFNDAQECNAIRDRLLVFAAKRAVWVVIHQNKAADNTQMKGHLGSMMEEAAVENYGVSSKNGVFEVKPLNARRSYIDESTEGVKFAMGQGGTIITATAILEGNKEKEREQWAQDLRLIFGEDTELSRGEIAARIMDAQGLAKSAADNKIAAAAAVGAIVKVDPSKHRSPYRLLSVGNSDFDDIDDDDL